MVLMKRWVIRRMPQMTKTLKLNYDTKNGIRIPKGAVVEVVMEIENQNYIMVKYNDMYLPVQKEALE